MVAFRGSWRRPPWTLHYCARCSTRRARPSLRSPLRDVPLASSHPGWQREDLRKRSLSCLRQRVTWERCHPKASAGQRLVRREHSSHGRVSGHQGHRHHHDHGRSDQTRHSFDSSPAHQIREDARNGGVEISVSETAQAPQHTGNTKVTGRGGPFRTRHEPPPARPSADHDPGRERQSRRRRAAARPRCRAARCGRRGARRLRRARVRRPARPALTALSRHDRDIGERRDVAAARVYRRRRRRRGDSRPARAQRPRRSCGCDPRGYELW